MGKGENTSFSIAKSERFKVVRAVRELIELKSSPELNQREWQKEILRLVKLGRSESKARRSGFLIEEWERSNLQR